MVGHRNWLFKNSYLPILLWKTNTTLNYEIPTFYKPVFAYIFRPKSADNDNFSFLSAHIYFFLMLADQCLVQFIMLTMMPSQPFDSRNVARSSGNNSNKLKPLLIGSLVPAYLSLKTTMVGLLRWQKSEHSWPFQSISSASHHVDHVWLKLSTIGTIKRSNSCYSILFSQKRASRHFFYSCGYNI